ncbi:hypothetical protein E3G52_000286 [Mycobacteroides abscessus]|uniref:hypothetical protein n=1 Tax=Mycobacteroides abscessus TaxID=36809 RepID=UPI001878E5EE|nr:hypothetical protein [Mycobacteroides abscessus]MBE5453422.1 hypothetical protein [Mycobacteroides abscessus]
MIENTTNRDPLLHLLGSMGGNHSSYIEGMERDGQQQLVNSDLLPVDAGYLYGENETIDGWDVLAKLGFQRGEPVSGDDLFVHATLPEGWSRKGGSHAMHSSIVDQRGIDRVRIFYKAAFYDRRASMSVIQNPGADLASKAIYGDEPAALPSVWSAMTDNERAGYRGALDQYLSRAEDHPDIYGDRLPRVQELIAFVEAAQ